MNAIPNTQCNHVRIAVIGAGLSGVAAGVALKQDGIDDFVILERADDIGGVWRDNTYPGIACDVPSQLYSYAHAPNPDWSRTFAQGQQIHGYVRSVATQHGLTGHLRLGQELLSASWDDPSQHWSISTPDLQLTANVLIDATGPLTDPQLPDIPGLDSFEGTVFHSARWNHEHDLRGERVAVIGSGASSIQFVPRIQPLLARLVLLQRTPGWVMPRFDRSTTAAERRLFRHVPTAMRAQRLSQYLVRDGLHYRMIRRNRAVRVMLEGVARHHLRRHVADPQLRAKLTPGYEIGCKRILISNDWYRALAQPNVDVVAAGLREVRGRTVIASDGSEHEVDTIILGTGFEVVPPPITERILGRDHRSLAQLWRQRLRHYRAIEVAGFPNYFRLAGVGCGVGHGSMISQIEAQITYLRDALRTMSQQRLTSIEVSLHAQDDYIHSTAADAAPTVWALGGCNSWYLDEHGDVAMWPRSMHAYRRLMRCFEPEHHHLQTGPPARKAPRDRHRVEAVTGLPPLQ